MEVAPAFREGGHSAAAAGKSKPTPSPVASTAKMKSLWMRITAGSYLHSVSRPSPMVATPGPERITAADACLAFLSQGHGGVCPRRPVLPRLRYRPPLPGA